MSGRIIRASVAIAAIGLTSGWLASGCASSSKADTTSDSMAATNTRMDKGIAQVDAMVNAMNAIVSGKSGDLRPLYKKFVEELDRTESHADSTRKSAQAMKDKAQAQFEAWANEAQNIGDPALKEANLKRRNEARATYAKAQDASQKVKTAYEPFVTGLRDLKTFLGTDLTSRGVDAVTPTIQKVASSAESLKAAIREFQGTLTTLKSQLVSPEK